MGKKEKIEELKHEENAVILGHNYQREEVQKIADFLGDSLGLSKQAAKTEADTIIFCGVKFMAETAKILSPDKQVLLPERDSDCPMANMVTPEEIEKMKEDHPNAKVVSYVNTTAEVKAVSDVCCTSSNAIDVVKNLNAETVIFTPDKNLGSWVQRFVDKEMVIWDGHCYVHNHITPAEVKKSKENMPEATLIVHPECKPEVADLADEVGSTGDMVDYAKRPDVDKMIIGTEMGLIKRLQREHPEKEFYSAGSPKICQGMKKITIDSVYEALKNNRYEIELENKVKEGAKKALDKMLKYS